MDKHGGDLGFECSSIMFLSITLNASGRCLIPHCHVTDIARRQQIDVKRDEFVPLHINDLCM